MTVKLHKTVWFANARHATGQVTQKLLVYILPTKWTPVIATWDSMTG